MEEKRQYLASQGYYIRKLNQAYFAFYGAYSDKPAFISPIGLELKELRNRSASLKDFLNTVATMKSRQDLRNSLTLGDADEVTHRTMNMEARKLIHQIDVSSRALIN